MNNSFFNDLAIGQPFIAGKPNAVRNCWHFYTDGSSVELFFYDKDSFIFGMNLIFFLTREFPVTVLAFTLMETHVHFILYGGFSDSNKFIHEYVREMAIYTRNRFGIERPLRSCNVSQQEISDESYLKTAISYVLRNPLVAGLPYSPSDYPWSSGALYFRSPVCWCNPRHDIKEFKKIKKTDYLQTFSTKRQIPEGTQLVGALIHPSEYVAVDLVEKVFRSRKSFYYHQGKAKEDEVESYGGAISRLSIPIREMRIHKRDACMELFGTNDVRRLRTEDRIRLARTLRSRFNSSPKQIARLCGLVYEELTDIL